MSGYGFTTGTTGYDTEDRLVTWNRADNTLNKSWNLSLVGDWTSVTENTTTQSRTHGPTHELLTAAGQSVTTDTKGNITLLPAALRPSTNPLSLTWDQDNRLSSADVDNDSVADVSYQWDALGRRVARDDGTNVTIFVQSGQQTIADYLSGAAPASPTYTYYYASYIDEPVMRAGTGGLRYYHRGQQYSINALTNSSGSIVERYAYDAYGDVTITNASGSVRTSSSENNRYTYTGREWDEELGLYHYRARMYDAEAGRFCSRDPIGFFGSEWNLYEYTSGNPVVRFDPFGLDWLDCMGNCLREKNSTAEVVRKGTTATIGMRKVKLASLSRVQTQFVCKPIFNRIGTQCGRILNVSKNVCRKVVSRTVVVITIAEGALSWWDIANCQWECM